MKLFLTLLIQVFMIFNLFGQKRPVHQENWSGYTSNIDSIYSTILCDLGWHGLIPVKSYEKYIVVSIKANSFRENGFPDKKEFDFMYKVEDKLVEILTKKDNAIFVGTTTNTHRDLYFYVSNNKTDYSNELKESLKEYSDHKIEIYEKADKKWEMYAQFLYPDDSSMNNIQNRLVLDNVEKEGDNLTTPRNVGHWIYFRTEKDRATYEQEVLKLGYKIENKDIAKTDKKNKNPFTLHISKSTSIEEDTINEITWSLKLLANKFNGDYDGWETEIVRRKK